MLTQKYVAQMQSFYDGRMCFTHSLFLRSIQSGNRLSLYNLSESRVIMVSVADNGH